MSRVLKDRGIRANLVLEGRLQLLNHTTAPALVGVRFTGDYGVDNRAGLFNILGYYKVVVIFLKPIFQYP